MWNLGARVPMATDPFALQHWDEAIEQAERGWLDGEDQNGELITSEGPQPANSAFRFGVKRGKKLRDTDALKGSQTTTGRPRSPCRRTC